MLKVVNVFRCDAIGTARTALELVKTGDVLQFNIGGAFVNFQVLERESMLLHHLDESAPEPLAPLADLDVVGEVVHVPEAVPLVTPTAKKSLLDFFRR